LGLPIDRATQLAPGVTGLALGDVNGDGHLDVIVGAQTGGVGIFLGAGTGWVNPPQIMSNAVWTSDLALVDMDGDLDVDIVTGGLFAYSVRLLRNRGNGTFDDAVPLGEIGRADAIAIGDIDEDGLPDVVPARTGVETFDVYRGANGYSAAGTIEIGRRVFTPRLTVTDLDGDHHLDVCVPGFGTWWGGANGISGQ
jgi:hypothetical protein